MIPVTMRQREIEKKRILDNLCYSYDQQPGESNNNYELFNIYKNMGRSRTYGMVADICPYKTPQNISKISIKNRWKKRVVDYDLEKDRQMQMKLDDEIMVSRLRQMNIGSDMQKLAQKGLKVLESCVDELSPTDVSKLADIGVKIERLALGSSTEITESKVEVEGKVDVKVEELPKELVEKIGKELAIMASEKMEMST